MLEVNEMKVFRKIVSKTKQLDNKATDQRILRYPTKQ